ncbi:MAG: stage III sporulation protein AA, partial [Bacilli bacterium]
TDAVNAGVTMMASVHARSIRELTNRPVMNTLLVQGMFERIVLLERRVKGTTAFVHERKTNETYREIGQVNLG